jgi:hypothetical protein
VAKSSWTGTLAPAFPHGVRTTTVQVKKSGVSVHFRTTFIIVFKRLRGQRRAFQSVHILLGADSSCLFGAAIYDEETIPLNK